MHGMFLLQLVNCYDVYTGMSMTTQWRNSDGERILRHEI